MSPRPMQGTTISGRYELSERLGSGGMSSVYKATDKVLERTVAVKVLAEHLSDDEKFVARFRREALAVAKLVHPNVVQVYDTGVDEERHFIVMEYVEGRSGAQILNRAGRLSPEVAAEIGVQACAGLEYAHTQGIVHRDVKPGNLLIIGGPAAGGDGADGGSMTVKIADFGIARAAEQTRLTQVGAVVGTAAYLAPEQTSGGEASPASDVYALGVVIYQFMAGRLPYEGSTLAELAMRRESEKPLPPHTYNDAVPEALSSVVLRALESDPVRRYGTAHALGAALRNGMAGRFAEPLEDEGPTARLAEPPTPAQTYHPPTAPTPYPPPAPSPRRRSTFGTMMGILGIVLLIAAIAAIVVAVVLLATNGGSQTEVGDILRDSVDQQIESLRDVINENTGR